MALAWLGHLRFKQLSYWVAIPLAWLLVLPEYALNIAALRRGYGRYSGGQMAAFRLCSGVVCVALVARLVLGEPLTTTKLVGFALMLVAMVLVAAKPRATLSDTIAPHDAAHHTAPATSASIVREDSR